MKRFFTLLFKILTGFIGLLLVFLAVSVAPVDRALPEEQDFYQRMMKRIDEAFVHRTHTDTSGFQFGYSKVSITPGYPVATAGYIKRKRAKITGIRDSVFVRTMVIRQGNTEAAIVSLDMLIVPPVLFNRLSEELKTIHFPIDQVYLGATHTHNSNGHWDDHLVGQIYAGEFDEALIDFLAQRITAGIIAAQQDCLPGTLRYGVIPVREAVTNRVIRENGPVDSLFHLVETVRSDGTTGILASYSAHATCLATSDVRLSRDYPGELVDNLEASGYSFAMFMAGAVGSHAPIPNIPESEERIERMGSILTHAAQQAQWYSVTDHTLQFARIPLLTGKQQIKVLPNWRVREWLSLRLMGNYTPSLTVLQVGNVVMLGTPCDFSGMLTNPIYATAHQQQLHAFVTSFNGGYIGYVTPDRYYDLQHYETQTMNWYGPGNGGYLQQCLMRMLEKTSAE